MWHEHNLRWNPHILPGARNSALHPVGRVAEVIAPLPHLQVSADSVDEEQEWPGWGQHGGLTSTVVVDKLVEVGTCWGECWVSGVIIRGIRWIRMFLIEGNIKIKLF